MLLEIYSPFPSSLLITFFHIVSIARVTTCPNSPETVQVCTCYHGLIIDRASFLSQNYPSLGDKLYGHSK